MLHNKYEKIKTKYKKQGKTVMKQKIAGTFISMSLLIKEHTFKTTL